jgi:hypothetical protein
MKSCPQCGLANIPERQTCKHCASPLDPQPQAASGAERFSLPRGWLWRLLFVAAFVLVAPNLLQWQVSSALRDPNHIPTPRGSMILKLRVPADQPPLRDLELYADGTIASGTIDAMYFSENRHVAVHTSVLDQAALQEVLQFQHAWCGRDARIYHPTTQTPAYGLGIWCDGHIEEAHIAPRQLPAALRHVVMIAFPDEASE